jgi:phosphatidylglycerophosphatase A
MQKLSDRIGMMIARGLFVGNSPVVPGTAGTLAAIPLYLILAWWLPGWAYLAATAAIIAIGIWAAGVTERVTGIEDPGVVIIDEVAGFLVTMAGHPLGWGRVIGGFFLFRVFDVLKPPPVRRLERLGSGLGIVADDLGAGIYANLALHGTAWVVSRWMAG